MQNFDRVVDVLVVGSGAGGLTAAWAAARKGLNTFVIEKAAVFGGNTAISGGGAWMPNAPELVRHGQSDAPDALLRYLQAIAPNVDPQRQRRYLEEAPKLHAALEETASFHNGFFRIEGYSDYHPHLGGSPLGHGLWPKPIDARRLREEAANLRGSYTLKGSVPRGVWITSKDLKDALRLKWGAPIRNLKFCLRMAGRLIYARTTGARMVTHGSALITRLWLAGKAAGVMLQLKTPLKSLILDENKTVIGVEAEQDGKTIRIHAKQGVILAAGGFEFDQDMRNKYQPALGKGHSLGAESNTGDAIRAAQDIGAATALMDDSWWMPGVQTPAAVIPMLWERHAPRQFVVNGSGRRFVNEAAPYTDFGRVQLAGQAKDGKHIPAYMITDHLGWTRNVICAHLPGAPMPESWIESGVVSVADTLEELADKIGVPRKELIATANRFNEFARNGRDTDFHRGESPYDHYYGDTRRPNPNLGEVTKAPFYAFRLVLSDLGTKGGLLTNENAQVLDQSGATIAGLYAVGNTSAAVMGNSYAGPGSTIGPAMTFGWIAANNIARHLVD